MRRSTLVFILIAAVGGPPPGVAAQKSTVATRETFAQSEIERYLRALHVQDTANSRPTPWSLRPFGPPELEALAASTPEHPWAARYDFAVPPRASWGIIAPRVRLIYNSAFPHGSGDGVVWAGRGVTASLQAGVAGRWGPLSVSLAPIAFRTQNRSFEGGEFSAPRRARFIDLPTRFGDGPYTRIDPGQSTVRMDAFGLAAGISTADQQWGPAAEYPLLLGNNAGGFPHVFIGTSGPANIGIGRISARLIGARLDQSAFSPVQVGEDRRFAAAAIGLFAPRGFRGLELGVARFYHKPWPADGVGLADLFRPFEGFLKQGLMDENPDARDENQLASVFFRWAPAGSGFEVYGEFLREDHSYDLRHLLLEPNDRSGYNIGFARVWGSRDGMTVVRGEVMNTENARRGRAPSGGGDLYYPYSHVEVRQGHTQRGQLLVPRAAFAGAGAVVAVDRYGPRGKWSAEWRREQRRSRARVESDLAPAIDVLHAWGVDVSRFTPLADVSMGLTGIYDFNRDFGSDAWSWALRIGLTSRL